jgi:biopolymer transport protein ExbD
MRIRRPTPEASGVVLPITPMLDMAFQLLTFFLFTYRPSAMEVQMGLSLPMEQEAAAKDDKDVKNDAKPTKERDIPVKPELVVSVEAQTAGYTVTLEDRAGKEEFTNKQLNDLLDKLKNQDAKAREKVLLKGSSKTRIESMMEVMDVCRKAECQEIIFSEPPDFKKLGE